jgi:hypothetical protein
VEFLTLPFAHRSSLLYGTFQNRLLQSSISSYCLLYSFSKSSLCRALSHQNFTYLLYLLLREEIVY